MSAGIAASGGLGIERVRLIEQIELWEFSTLYGVWDYVMVFIYSWKLLVN